MLLQLWNEIYQRVVSDELGEGYRGYRVLSAGIAAKDNDMVFHAIHMYMLNSPLHPRDAMLVGDKLRNPVEIPEDLETLALNDVLSMKRLIDLAYEKPEEVADLRPLGQKKKPARAPAGDKPE